MTWLDNNYLSASSNRIHDSDGCDKMNQKTGGVLIVQYGHDTVASSSARLEDELLRCSETRLDKRRWSFRAAISLAPPLKNS